MAKTVPAKTAAPPPIAIDAETAPARPPSLKVRAIGLGYYEHIRRRAGDVFKLTDPVHFADTWMEWVDARTPERVTSAPQALKEHHDEMIASRYAPPGSMHADDDDNPLGG
jgi:hypothetical protein